MTLRTALASMAVLFTLPAWSAALPDIVLLGDDIRVAVLQQCPQPCRSGSNSVATAPQGSSASSIASLAQRAKHAVIVVDATQGPLPITREHIQVARQSGVPSLSILLVNVAQVDDTELLELEELEIRELLNAYEMHGDSAPVFYDASHAAEMPVQQVNGLASALAALKDEPARPELGLTDVTGKNLATVIYLLTPEESALSLPLRKDSPVNVWVNGQVGHATVSSTNVLNPGDNGELALQLSAPVSAAAGSRLLLEREGRIIALGVVVGISAR